jgi:hypothetical protein
VTSHPTIVFTKKTDFRIALAISRFSVCYLPEVKVVQQPKKLSDVDVSNMGVASNQQHVFILAGALSNNWGGLT